jgi:hypothetical protein
VLVVAARGGGARRRMGTPAALGTAFFRGERGR